jgi:hypothetical protein
MKPQWILRISKPNGDFIGYREFDDTDAARGYADYENDIEENVIDWYRSGA